MEVLNNTTAKETIERIKSAKIARGCKITFVSNKVFIDYPIHKTRNGQYDEERKQLEALFPLCSIVSHKIQNNGGINIWLNN